MYTVGQLKDGVAGILSGTNLTKVTGLNKVLERAARKLLTKADVPEASEKQAITLYDGVDAYEINERIFGSALIDVRPQGVTRWYGEDALKTPIREWDRKKHVLPSGYRVAFEFKDGAPIARIVASRPLPRTIIDTMDDSDDWTVGGSLGSLTEDSVVYYDNNTSLRFTLTGSSTGTLERTLDTALDLENYRNVAVGFLAFRLPEGATIANLTSIAVRLGSSSGNYDEVSVTEGFLGAWTAGEWIIVAFDQSVSTTTGSPDWTALDYVQFRFAHTGTLSNIRVGGFWLSLPSPHEIIYQSSAIFNSTSGRSKSITNDDDEIVLNDAAYVLYEHECALAICVQNKQHEKAKELRITLYEGEGDSQSLYDAYRADSPSQEMRTVSNYYEEIENYER